MPPYYFLFATFSWAPVVITKILCLASQLDLLPISYFSACVADYLLRHIDAFPSYLFRHIVCQTVLRSVWKDFLSFSFFFFACSVVSCLLLWFFDAFDKKCLTQDSRLLYPCKGTKTKCYVRNGSSFTHDDFFFFIGPGKWGDQRLKAKEGFGQACASLVKIYIKLALSATV